jgi:hypothetical protein
MSGAFAGDDSKDENWLQEHNKEFQNPGAFSASGAPDWRSKERKRPPRRPIRVGKTKQRCPHCGEMAPPELFRDTKCLACQAADFLGPIH